jgi:hypothetical protein
VGGRRGHSSGYRRALARAKRRLWRA